MSGIRIGNWSANAGGGGTGFTVESLDGWFKQPSTSRERIARPRAAGSFDVPGFPDARVVAVQGLCFADSAHDLNALSELFAASLSDGLSHMVSVDMEWGTTFGYGAHVSSEFDHIVWGSIASWQLQLLFADPRRYGASHVFAAATSLSLFHYGNYPALPVLTVTGVNAGGYTIAGPGGKLFTVTQPLVSGHPHTVSMADGYLRVDGVPVFGQVTNADLFAVPGGVATPVSISGGTAKISTTVLDTYL